MLKILQEDHFKAVVPVAAKQNSSTESDESNSGGSSGIQRGSTKMGLVGKYGKKNFEKREKIPAASSNLINHEDSSSDDQEAAGEGLEKFFDSSLDDSEDLHEDFGRQAFIESAGHHQQEEEPLPTKYNIPLGID